MVKNDEQSVAHYTSNLAEKIRLRVNSDSQLHAVPSLTLHFPTLELI